MADDSGPPEGDGDSDSDTQAKENGSEAVERRIEKVMSDLRDQNIVDARNEVAYDAKKVSEIFLSPPTKLMYRVRRRRFHWPCIWHIFGLRFTHATTAPLYPITLRNCSVNV